MALTQKQEIFVAEYLKDLNGKRAAIAAGYSAKTAEVSASRLLRVVKVATEIAKRRDKYLQKLDISTERVLDAIGRVAFFDPRKLFAEDGTLIPVKQLDDETAPSIAGIEHEKLFEHFGKGQAQEVGTTTKVKLADRLRALELLGRYHKLFTDKVEVSGMDELAIAIQNARARVAKK